MIASLTAAILTVVVGPAAPKGKCDAASVYAEADAVYSIKGQTAADRVPFHKKPAAAAKEKVTLAIGDQVLVGGPKTDDFRCAAFGDPEGKLIVGFLPVANLQRAYSAENELSQSFLEGKWIGPSGSLSFEKRGDNLINIDAKGTSGRTDLEGDAKILGQKITFADDEDDETTCRLTIERRGPLLLVSDNSRCTANKTRYLGIFAKVSRS